VVHDLTGMPHILPTHQRPVSERILFKRRKQIRELQMVEQPPVLRHFSAKFEEVH
jgi:tryptophanase